MLSGLRRGRRGGLDRTMVLRDVLLGKAKGVTKRKKTSGGTAGGRSRKSAAKASGRPAGRARKTGPKLKAATAAGAKLKRAAGPAAGPQQRRRQKKLKTQLSKKELKEFREILLTKRRQLLGDLTGMEQVAATQKGSGNLSSMPTHMADVGTDNFEHEFTLGLLESEQALLREINEALARIGERTYGICLGTGRQIPKLRLRAKPWAKYTVQYTRMLEKGLVRAQEADQGESPEAPDESEEQ